MMAIYQVTSKNIVGEKRKKAVEAIKQMITRLNVSTCVNDGNFFRFSSQFAGFSVNCIAKTVTHFMNDALCPFRHFVLHFSSHSFALASS